MSYLPEVNRLRGVAMVLVVMTHATDITTDTQIGAVLHALVHGATWIFVFVAGFLMAHLRERYTYGSYLQGKLQSVIAPYIMVVSLALITGLSATQADSLAELPGLYLLGRPVVAPLWFIPMIVLFYLAFPAYRWLCNHTVVLLSATLFCLTLAFNFGRPPTHWGPLPNFVYFQSSYLAGIAVCVHREKVMAFAERYLPWLIAGTLASALLVSILGLGPLQLVYLSFLTLTLLAVLRREGPLTPVWEWIAPRSFGIFFLHGLFTDRAPQILGRDNNALVALGFSIAVLVGCGLFVAALQAVLGRRSRLFVGS